MISSLSLLSLAWVANPIVISDVTASRENGRVVVEVAADAMVDPEAARAKISDGQIYLFLGDTRVKADNRSWGEGAAQIRAHRHRHEVELVVPMGENSACQGPVEFTKAPSGLRALVGCDASAMGAGRTARSAATAARGEASRPKAPPVPAGFATPILTATAGTPVDPPPAARKAEAGVRRADASRDNRDNRELKAVLGLNEGPTAADDELLEPKARPVAAAKPVAPALVAVPVVDKPTPVTARGAAPLPPVTTPVAAAAPAPLALALSTPVKTDSAAREPASVGNAASNGGGGAGIYLGALLLLGLGAAAYFFARKRATVPRFVRIMETASLGPKRSIVVAQINGETMILGTSEAGITVLQARVEPNVASLAAAAVASIAAPAPVAAAAPATSSTAIDATLAIDDFDFPDTGAASPDAGLIPEADVDDSMPAQGGLLARLFRRGKPANESEFHNFEELLEDSVEDQELRHKLSLGLAGRVR